MHCPRIVPASIMVLALRLLPIPDDKPDAGCAIMPTSSTTAAANAAATLRKLQDISDQIREIAKRPRGAVQEYQKDTRDVLFDNNATARDIGQLVQDKTRLNVISALSKNDDADVFKFRIAKTAATKIGTLNTGATSNALRYQVFSKSPTKLIADSDPGAGDAYKNYQDLEAGKLEMKAGDYVVRISRKAQVDTRKTAEFQYAVQFSQGTFTQDYDTVEKAYRPGTDNPFGLPLSSAAAVLNLLSGGSGSSSTRFSGSLYDALF